MYHGNTRFHFLPRCEKSAKMVSNFSLISLHFLHSLYFLFSGGLTNHIFYCSLPPSSKSRISNPNEPSEVLLRLYGASYSGYVESERNSSRESALQSTLFPHGGVDYTVSSKWSYNHGIGALLKPFIKRSYHPLIPPHTIYFRLLRHLPRIVAWTALPGSAARPGQASLAAYVSCCLLEGKNSSNKKTWFWFCCAAIYSRLITRNSHQTGGI
jgi:hypothetical protein